MIRDAHSNGDSSDKAAVLNDNRVFAVRYGLNDPFGADGNDGVSSAESRIHGAGVRGREIDSRAAVIGSDYLESGRDGDVPIAVEI